MVLVPEKTIILVGIYNQQFQRTIILMVFDFIYMYIYIYIHKNPGGQADHRKVGIVYPTSSVEEKKTKTLQNQWLSKRVEESAMQKKKKTVGVPSGLPERSKWGIPPKKKELRIPQYSTKVSRFFLSGFFLPEMEDRLPKR